VIHRVGEARRRAAVYGSGMAWLRRHWDLGLAMVLAAVAWLDVISHGRPLLDWCFAALITLPLAARRSHPLPAVVAVMAAVAGKSLLSEPPESVWTLVVFIICAYSVAAHAPLVPAIVGLAASCGAIGLSVVLDASDSAANVAPTLLVFLGIPWAAGRAFYTRATRAARERREAAAAAVNAERLRVARELHDIVAHGISVIAVQADAALGVLDRDPSKVREPLETIKRSAHDALAEMRDLLGVLRTADSEAALSPAPRLGDLDALIAQMRAAGLQAELRIEGDPVPLAPSVELSAYRVAQEGLTNALRYAASARAWVTVRYDAAGLEVEVADDGRRTVSADPGGGHGLPGMRERVALLGGRLEAGRRPEGGFRLHASFPARP
jgi:signal transduction histidine kinase